jgi:hypothetical protein
MWGDRQCPTSVVGSEILAQHADLVLTFDTTIPERNVLGGRYVEVGSKVIQPKILVLYRRVGYTCRAPGFTPPLAHSDNVRSRSLTDRPQE